MDHGQGAGVVRQVHSPMGPLAPPEALLRCNELQSPKAADPEAATVDELTVFLTAREPGKELQMKGPEGAFRLNRNVGVCTLARIDPTVIVNESVLGRLDTRYRGRVPLEVFDTNTRIMERRVNRTGPHPGGPRKALIDLCFQVFNGVPGRGVNFKTLPFQQTDPLFRLLHEPMHLGPGDGPRPRKVGPQHPP